MGKIGTPNWKILDGVPTYQYRHPLLFRSGPGWIYAVQEDGTPLVKIGYTREYFINKRMANLWGQFRVPVTLIAAVYVEAEVFHVERQLHRMLAASRIEREWFYLYMNQTTLESLVNKAMYLLTEQGPT